MEPKTKEELQDILRIFINVHIEEARLSGLDDIEILNVIHDISRSLEPTKRHPTPYPGLLNRISTK